MKKIAIFGAGGFGREVLMLIDQINQINHQFDFVGFYDDGLKKGSMVAGFPVLGGVSDLSKIAEELYLVISIADPSVKRKLLSSFENHFVLFPTLIHPSCCIGSSNVTIGNGTIICAGSIVTVDVVIGEHVIINLSCTIGHDTQIGSFSSLMPAVNISGEVIIGEGAYFGTGAKVINLVNIGSDVIVGAGAVVTKELPSNCTAVGIPAKPIKYNNGK
jgi:sugar O-acyltransferase (sialic acid O-acetyltransferase NeuD family)